MNFFTKIKIISVLCVCFCIFYFTLEINIAFSQDTAFKIHFIDVGEGDSIFIETPGGETVLIDAGNPISGFKVVDYLKRKGIQSIDHLIFTHPHLDHIGGVFSIMHNFLIKNIYDNGEDISRLIVEQDIYRWYEQLVRKNRAYRSLARGDEIVAGEVKLKAIWPYNPTTSSDFNVNSLVIMVKYGNFSCLLAGDLPVSGEEELVRQNKDLGAEVLKLGHHGAEDAGFFDFLRAVSPQISIISVDRDNIRGYPSKNTINRLEKIDSQLYRTDINGNIIVYPNEQGAAVEVEKKQ